MVLSTELSQDAPSAGVRRRQLRCEYAGTADRREQAFDDDLASSSGRSVLQAAQHDGIVGLLELDRGPRVLILRKDKVRTTRAGERSHQHLPGNEEVWLVGERRSCPRNPTAFVS